MHHNHFGLHGYNEHHPEPPKENPVGIHPDYKGIYFEMPKNKQNESNGNLGQMPVVQGDVHGNQDNRT